MAQVIIEYDEYQELLSLKKDNLTFKTESYEDVMSLNQVLVIQIDKDDLLKHLGIMYERGTQVKIDVR